MWRGIEVGINPLVKFVRESDVPSAAKAGPHSLRVMYGLKPVPFMIRARSPHSGSALFIFEVNLYDAVCSGAGVTERTRQGCFPPALRFIAIALFM